MDNLETRPFQYEWFFIGHIYNGTNDAENLSTIFHKPSIIT